MTGKNTLLITILVSTLLQIGPGFAQDRADLRATLFEKTELALAEARAQLAPILSPRLFEEASKKYNEALRDFQKGSALKDIEEKLQEVNARLRQASQVTQIGHTTFATTLKAREDALEANAPEYASELFQKAESKFLDSTRKLEKGDSRDVKKEVPGLDSMFRQAELVAIKTTIIGTVRNLIQEAKRQEADKYTPITYARAVQLLNEAEAILNSNRRSEISAKKKAEAAEIEAKHAIYLTEKLQMIRRNPTEWENIIHSYENAVEAIAGKLGFEPHFEEGIEKPLRHILILTQNLQNEKKELLTEVDQQNTTISSQSKELQQYKEKERGLQAELQEKQYKLELKRQREEKIHAVEAMFARNEAIVLIQGNNLILRLIGLSFRSGRATIEPEYFSLLSTVQRAIRKFDASSIVIEGHTDALGNDQFNQNLSQERAIAVKQYLLANMGLDESKITALGYGEGKPIASNETESGRAQNRRIDVVLTFGHEPL